MEDKYNTFFLHDSPLALQGGDLITGAFDFLQQATGLAKGRAEKSYRSVATQATPTVSMPVRES